MYLYIGWNEITSSGQDELIEQIKPYLIDKYREDGKRYLTQDWYDPQPQDWKEAFIRMNGIESIMWAGYEEGDEGEQPDFDGIFDDYLEEQAVSELVTAFKNASIEVEL